MDRKKGSDRRTFLQAGAWRRSLSVRCALALVVGLVGCDAGGDARVEVLVTDAPSDMIASADVWVSAVYLQGGDPADDDVDADGVDDGMDDDVPGRTYLLDEPMAESFDLMLLRDGNVESLTGGLVDVPVGEYGQLRIVIDSAFVTLNEGYAFEDGSTSISLITPSAMQSGIKVGLAEGAIAAGEGEEITILVDIDVDQNFVIQQNPDQTVRTILFTPSLQEIDRSVAGEDDGLVG